MGEWDVTKKGQIPISLQNTYDSFTNYWNGNMNRIAKTSKTGKSSQLLFVDGKAITRPQRSASATSVTTGGSNISFK